jgi:hypothetical protein
MRGDAPEPVFDLGFPLGVLSASEEVDLAVMKAPFGSAGRGRRDCTGVGELQS